jgi:CheY-like chemotaxis protein
MPDTEIRRALVVEDEPRSARLLATILSQLADDVLVAGTGNEALDALAEQEFGLVTLDIALPGLSGIELLPHVRELTDAPVMMVTAHDDLSLLVEALAGGADDYIVKPIRRPRSWRGPRRCCDGSPRAALLGPEAPLRRPHRHRLRPQRGRHAPRHRHPDRDRAAAAGVPGRECGPGQHTR